MIREKRGLTIDGAHDEFYLHGVGSACEMGVDLFGLCLIERHKPVENVVTSSGIIRTTLTLLAVALMRHERLTIIVWEVVLHGADWELLLETIDLVQEQDDARLDEPS